MKLFTVGLFSLTYFLISTSSFATQTKIYHWVDDKGNIHFSDTAKEGTEQIQVHNDNILEVDQEAQITRQQAKDKRAAQAEQQQPAIEYQATIISPEDDSALRSNDGSMNIQVQSSPVKESNQYQLFLDGKAFGSPQSSPMISVLNVDRGSHQVQVQLLDEESNILTSTQVITVHLQRASKGIKKL